LSCLNLTACKSGGGSVAAVPTVTATTPTPATPAIACDAANSVGDGLTTTAHVATFSGNTGALSCRVATCNTGYGKSPDSLTCELPNVTCQGGYVLGDNFLDSVIGGVAPWKACSDISKRYFSSETYNEGPGPLRVGNFSVFNSTYFCSSAFICNIYKPKNS
jgi:hypothetical protein